MTKSALETKKVARMLAKEALKTAAGDRALVIGLVGELGSGKTTFAQGFAEGLGIKERVLSPTFVLMRRYAVSPTFNVRRGRSLNIGRYQTFVHIDCYRLDNPKELLALGWDELVADQKNIILIEWADLIKSVLPGKTLFIEFKVQNEKFKITVKN